MTHTTFNVDGSALGACTRSMINPRHITKIEVQHGDAVVIFPQIFQPPPVMAAAALQTPEILSEELVVILKVFSSNFQEYRDVLLYYLGNPGPDCDVPDDEIREENAVEEEDQQSLLIAESHTKALHDINPDDQFI